MLKAELDNTVLKAERLQIASRRALLDFLQADIDLGFTLLSIAKTKGKLGDQTGFEQSRKEVLIVVNAVRRFKGRLSPEDQHQIDKRVSEIEKAISKS